MKNPSELAKEEQKKRELSYKEQTNKIESDLEEITAIATNRRELTSRGGTIEYKLSSPELASQEHQNGIYNYFVKYGWHCDFRLITAKGDTFYKFILTPIERLYLK